VPSGRIDYYRQVDDLTFAQKQELERRQRAGEDIYSFRLDGSSSDSNNTINYTVRRNDTLSSIARSHGVTISQIQNENNLNGTRIYAGQTLRITR
jgi:membrane-bound lytic murein transglycosylase D